MNEVNVSNSKPFNIRSNPHRSTVLGIPKKRTKQGIDRPGFSSNSNLKGLKGVKGNKNFKKKNELNRKIDPFRFAHSQSIKLTQEIEKESARRILERNKKTLFVKFPENSRISNHEEIQEILSNAISFRVPTYCNRHKFFKIIYAEFSSEEEAARELKRLKGMKLSTGDLFVDRLTASSENNVLINPYRLYVTGIPVEATEEHLEKLFPSAADIYRNKESKYRNNANFRTVAFLNYNSTEEAEKDFWKSASLSLLGRQILVLYAEVKTNRNKLKKR